MAKLINSNGNEREPTATVSQVKSGPQLTGIPINGELMVMQINENPN